MKVKNYKNPWVVDIWSLGCVLLEIIHGVPLWMSLPLMVEIGGKL
jgi:dual specificity tyrosine-phosphorylation-regulated kinase 2/3/4